MTKHSIAEQVRLEEEMRQLTVSRFHRRMNNATERGEFADTNIGRTIVCHLEKAMADALVAFKEEANTGKAGRKHAAVKMLDDIDTDTAAFLTTKAIVNALRKPSSRHGAGITVQRLAFSIAGMCHDEIRLRFFEQNNRALMRKMFKDFDKRDLPRRRRKELVQRSMSKLALDWEQEGWSDQNRLHFGIKMIDLFRIHTGVIEIADLQTGTKNQRKIVLATEEMVNAVQQQMDHFEALFTVYLPTIIKPRPWQQHNLFGGGYHTGNVTPYPLVKGSNRNYLEELENSDITSVLDAVNALQDTAWRVNPAMLEAVRFAFEKHGERVGLPGAELKEIPPKPAGADTDEEISRDFRKACYLVHDENRRNVAKRLAVLQGLSLANRMSKFEEIFFPHYLDSRGRAYPKPAILNPQGPDHIKALLEFADGKPVPDGSEGHAWIMVAAANAFGEDKLSLQGRIDWAEENAEMILSVGENPLDDLRWMDADEPFGFLRIAIELVAIRHAAAKGEVHISHLPVAVDATCSGIQHFSAMLRDEVGGTAVNLRALAERQDVYQQVADLVCAKLEHDRDHAEDLEVRQKAAAALQAGVSRKLTKRSTMIVPYNGTFHACMEYTTEHYSDLGLKPWEPMSAFIPFVAKHIWDAIAETVVASRGAMSWLTKVATAASKSEHALPMTWMTPAGFPVCQVRWESEQVRVRTFLDGKSSKLAYRKETNNLDVARMRSSVAPNFVHSMDAAHLQLTISMCQQMHEEGQAQKMSFAMVHDSFGVHACDMPVFAQVLRRAFHWMYTEHDVLADFLTSNLPIIDDDKQVDLPAVPKAGQLDLDEVLSSDFFFS